MSYTSRSADHLKARKIVSAAIDSRQRHWRLQRCRALLDQLDPNEPPVSAQAREYRWQYRALRERLHLFSERLETTENPERSSDHRLEQVEAAIELSLQYFNDVLAHTRPKKDSEDRDD
jgi:hypothetical protein